MLRGHSIGKKIKFGTKKNTKKKKKIYLCDKKVVHIVENGLLLDFLLQICFNNKLSNATDPNLTP